MRHVLAGLVIVVMIIALVIIPWQVGKETEGIYRNQVAQLNARGIDARVTSYDRGLYHSTATAAATYRGHRLKFTSHIGHGPFILWGQNASASPVLAAISTTMELPPELESLVTNNSKTPLAVRGVVNLNGTIDVSGRVAPFAAQFGPEHQPIECGGGKWKAAISATRLRWNATVAQLRVSGRMGASTLGKTELTGDMTRDSSGMWLGTAEFTSSEYIGANTLAIPDRGVMPVSIDAHNLRIAIHDWRDGSTVRLQDDISADHADLSGVEARAIALTFGLDNIDPAALEKWIDATRPVIEAAAAPAARAGILANRAMALLMALSKDEPKASAGLSFVTGFGAVDAKLNASLSPQMAGDPAFKDAQASPDNWKLLAETYLAGSGNLKLPAIAGALLSDPITQGNLVDEGFFTDEGDSIVTSANYAGGHLSISGRQIF